MAFAIGELHGRAWARGNMFDQITTGRDFIRVLALSVVRGALATLAVVDFLQGNLGREIAECAAVCVVGWAPNR
jgi:hypothetical protein